MPEAKTARLGELSARAGARVDGDADLVIDRVSSVDEAVQGALTFAVDARWLDKALQSKASAVIVPAALEVADRRGKSLVRAPDVRAALAAVLAWFAPPLPSGQYTHPTAVVAPSARRGAGVWIGAGVIVGERATLGEGAILLAGAYLGAGARIGARTLLHPRATVLDECVIGDDCILHSGCVIGSDGFGFVRVGTEQIKIPQIGNVVVGDRVEIGACTTIDRAVTGSTLIGAGTKIDNLVMIGHNVQIGEGCTLCGQVGIAGSSKLGPYVVAAGQVGISGHIEIGEHSLLLGQAGVTHSLPPRSRVSGYPAQPHRADMEQKVLLRKLPKVVDEFRALKAAVDELLKRS